MLFLAEIKLKSVGNFPAGLFKLMIINSLRVFFKNLIYVFIAMGIIYFFTIFAFFSFAISTVSNIRLMLDNSVALIQSAAENSEIAVKDFLSYSVSQIDMSGNVLDVLVQIINTNWIQNTVKGFLETLNMSTENFGNDFNVIINDFIDKFKNDFLVALTLLILGVICANYATRFVLRRKNAKRNIKKYLVAKFIEPLFLSLILFISLIILSVLNQFAVLVYIGFIILFAVLSLSSSWLIHRNGTMKFTQIVNGKNVLMFLASVLIIFVINVTVALILGYFSVAVAVIIMIPCAVYTLNIIGVGTDNFVCGLIKVGENYE